MVIPAFTIAFVGVACTQLVFLFGCCFYKFSTIILGRWKGDRKLYLDSKKKCAYLKSVLRSLSPLSTPAGGIGIIDKGIKVNYFNSLLLSVVDIVLTLKDRV